MISKDKIIEAVKAQPDRLGKRELSKILDIPAEEKRDLRMALRDLVDSGTLVQSGKKTYRVADDVPEVGVLMIDRVDEDGRVIAVPAKWTADSPAPEFIIKARKSKGKAPKDDAKIGPGTRILGRTDQRSHPYTVEIIRVLGPGPRREMGVIVKSGRGLRISPVNKKIRDEFIPAKDSIKVSDSDLVLFETARQSRRSRDGFKPAKIVEIVGDASDPKAASLISLVENDIPIGFDPEVMEEIRDLPRPVMGPNREDLRHVPLITIDPDDAKDFDDAVYAEPIEGGGFTVWVAIADVAAYVKPGSALDRNAVRKGNSVYLPDRVEPMLPHELSSDLCSLRPHEDRYCMAVQMHFDAGGHKTKHSFHRGLMRSHARLTYEQAQAAFDGEPDETAADVMESLTGIWQAYEALRTAREQREPLEIEIPERRVRVGEQGQITSIDVKARFDANKLIEEFMIQANVAAAESLSKKGMDLIFRVHEPPKRERIQSLSEFLPAVGMKFSPGERATPKRFNKILRQAEERDLAEVVGMAVLRTQSQAVYTPQNGGHFGLSLTHYAHFTSPIRRYADLIVHRALIAAFGFGKDGQSEEERTRLSEIAEHISGTERKTVAAERSAVDRYIAAHLADKVGVEFPGRITGVTKFGLFITLDQTGADAFAPARLLGEERFRFDEKRKQLTGEQTGGTYKFGARVTVKLLEALPVSGGLTVSVTSKPEPGKPGRGGHRGRRRDKGRGAKHKRKRSKK